jgi:PAS domain S-box-containing protein
VDHTDSAEARVQELEAENARLKTCLAVAGVDASDGDTDALRREAAILRTVTDHLSEAVFQMDSAGLVTFANPAAERMFGWTVPELLGRNLHDLLHHHHPDGTPYPVETCPMVRALKTGETLPGLQDVFFRKDGTPVDVVCSNAPVAVDGQVTSAVLTISDVTDRRRARERLRESEDRLDLASEASGGVGWWDWNVAADRVVANAAFARMYSVDPQEAVAGLPLSAFLDGVHPADRDAVAAAILGVVEAGGEYQDEYRLLHGDGTVAWVFARGRCYHRDGKPIRFPGVSLDITARKRSEGRQAALVELGDKLRDLSETREMAFAAAEIMGRTLELDRVGYGAVNPEQETITVERDWTAPGTDSITGSHRFRDYGAVVEDLKRGESVVIPDVARDARTAPASASYAAVKIGALINIPVVERGRLVALFYLNSCHHREWLPDEVDFIRNVADRTRAAIERVRAQEHQLLLANELQHRVKNTLSMVQAIAAQTFRETTSREVRDAFASRLVALGHANDLLTKAGWTAAPVRDIVTGATIPHCAGPERFTIAGPAVEIAARAALSLTLALHELCTNAAKYGALSNEDGHVDIDWEVAEATFRLRWAERGGPEVVKPTRTGFGSRLIQRTLGPQLGGQVTTDFDPDGLVCTLEVPLVSVQERAGPDEVDVR